MSNWTRTLGVQAILAMLVTSPLLAQLPAHRPDPMVASIQDGAKHVRSVFTKAAEQMTEEDYAFKPTPEVRSFGDILAHVAATSYWFCSAALGEESPVAPTEQTGMTRAEIQAFLAGSFAYCERAYAAMTDEAKATTMRSAMGEPRPALALLNFRTYHSLLHWGNAITYMRLRDKVPPSD